MLKALKRRSLFKFVRVERTDWELWLFVASLVTILGFFIQTHRQIESNLSPFRSQTKAEVYDIRVPNNNRVVQDRLETGR